MKRVLLLTLTLLFSVSVFAQKSTAGFDMSEYGIKIEPDRRLIVVLASLEAAGLETPLTEAGREFRSRLRADFASLYVPAPDGQTSLQQKMKFFVDQYAKRSFSKQRAALASEGKPAEDLKKFDEDVKQFFEQLEKSRAGQLSEIEKQAFLAKNRGFINVLVAPFISMAYTLGPVPDLVEPNRATDLPGDLLEVLDFSPYVRQFYRSLIKVKEGDTERTTTVGARIEEYYKEYQASGDAMRMSTAQMVKEVLDYLHTRPQTMYVEQIKTEVKTGKKSSITRTEDRERTRRFFIVPDLLAQEGTINFRNIGDDYYAIVPPGTDISESEVRRAYLQFVLDPIILKHAKDISTLREGLKVLLDERRKSNPDVSPDIFLAVSRSLVAATDARQIYFQKFQNATAEARRAVTEGRKPISETIDSAGRKVVRLTEDLYLIDGRFAMPFAEDEMLLKLSEAYERGAVLSFYFAQALKGLEESQFDIASSMREMLLSLDTTKEAARLSENAEARKRAIAKRDEDRSRAATIIENPLTKRLGEIEPLIQSQRYAQAETSLNELLVKYPTEPRIFYALGRTRSLLAASVKEPEVRNGHIEAAKNFLTKVIDPNAPQKPDAALASLTYAALARLYEYYDQNAYAIKIYEKVISMGDIKGGAYQEAVAARDRLMKEQQ